MFTYEIKYSKSGFSSLPLSTISSILVWILCSSFCHSSSLNLTFFPSCIMPIDKSWTDLNRVSKEFTNGLDSFVESCRPLVDSDGKIKCPCQKCGNRYSVNLIIMRRHIVTFGFFKRYIRWIYHGEDMVRRVVENDVS